MILPFYKFRCAFLEKLFELSVYSYRTMFKQKVNAWGLDLQDLSQYPNQSLGKALYIFITNNNFSVQDKLETHDIYHLLTETGITVPEEISMQYCLYASGKRSIYSTITICLGTLVLPEKIELYRSAYQMGKKMKNLSGWDFKSMLAEPLFDIREKIWKSNQATTNQLFNNSLRL